MELLDGDDVRVANPEAMATLIRQAKREGFNRQIDETVIEQLEGYSLVIPLLIHRHKAGVAVEPHVRCRVMLRFKADATAHEGTLDVDLESFGLLPTAKAVQS